MNDAKNGIFIKIPGRILSFTLFLFAILSTKATNREPLIPYSEYFQIAALSAPTLLFLIFLKPAINRFGKIILFLLFFTLILSLHSATLSDYQSVSIRRIALVFISTFTIFIFTVSDKTPEKTFLKNSWLLAIFGSLTSTYGLTLYLFGSVASYENYTIQQISLILTNLEQRVYGPNLRISSLFGNPNTFAAILMVTITFSYAASLLSRRRKIAWVLILIQIFALLLTSSRTGIATTLLSLLSAWYISKDSRGRTKAQAFLTLIAFVLVSSLIFAFNSSYLDVSSKIGAPDLLSERNLAWALLISSIIQSPFYGVGFGVSDESILYPGGLDFGAHNIYLALFAEIGIFGLLTVLVLWIAGVAYGYFITKHAERELRVIVGVSTSFLFALLIHQIFEAGVLRFSFTSLLWIYCLALLASSRLHRS